MIKPWRPWSAEEDAILQRMKLAGSTFPEVGHVLGRTEPGCQARLQRLRQEGRAAPATGNQAMAARSRASQRGAALSKETTA